jgi:hypothetical protein
MTTTTTTTYAVERYNILTTRHQVYCVWVPTDKPFGGGSTLRTIGDKWYYRLGTDPLPAELDSLPSWSEQRSAAVGAWHESLYEEAYALILRAFPADFGNTASRESMGEITRESNQRGSEIRHIG